MVDVKHLIGNKHAANAAFARWQALAESLGYDNQCSMLRDLYQYSKMSTTRIGNYLGFAKETINRRLHLCGVKMRPQGGPNHKGKKGVK